MYYTNVVLIITFKKLNEDVFQQCKTFSLYNTWGSTWIIQSKETETNVLMTWWLSGKESICNAGDTGLIPGDPMDPEDPLEKEMATDSSILSWEIPWTEEPGGLQSMGLQSVGQIIMITNNNTYEKATRV